MNALRTWCGLCGQDIEDGRRRCTCSAPRFAQHPDPVCERGKYVRRVYALLHLGVPEGIALARAFESLGRPPC